MCVSIWFVENINKSLNQYRAQISLLSTLFYLLIASSTIFSYFHLFSFVAKALKTTKSTNEEHTIIRVQRVPDAYQQVIQFYQKECNQEKVDIYSIIIKITTEESTENVNKENGWNQFYVCVNNY